MGRFDLDDVSPLLPQDRRGHRARDHRREIQHADSSERTTQDRLSRTNDEWAVPMTLERNPLGLTLPASDVALRLNRASCESLAIGRWRIEPSAMNLGFLKLARRGQESRPCQRCTGERASAGRAASGGIRARSARKRND